MYLTTTAATQTQWLFCFFPSVLNLAFFGSDVLICCCLIQRDLLWRTYDSATQRQECEFMYVLWFQAKSVTEFSCQKYIISGLFCDLNCVNWYECNKELIMVGRSGSLFLYVAS